MLKNKTIFKSIAVALIMFMMVAALSPSVGTVYAAFESAQNPYYTMQGDTLCLIKDVDDNLQGESPLYGISERGTATSVNFNTHNAGAYTFTDFTALISVDFSNLYSNSISEGIFKGCTSLASIAVTSNITSIGAYAFANCTSLTSITYDGTMEQWNAITKGEGWDSNTGDYTITCSDGTIAKSDSGSGESGNDTPTQPSEGQPITGADKATGSTNVEYTVDQTGWTFSVPAAQTFTKENLILFGNVSIKPESGKDIISLPSGQTINMTFTAANFNDGVFELRNGSNSVIPYTIGRVSMVASEGEGNNEIIENITSNGCSVLTYIAGSSSNEGVTYKLRFATTLDNIKNAKVTGLHTDTLTFTVNVTGGTSGGGSESGGGTTTPTLISFTMYSGDTGLAIETYYAEEGMTLEQWVNSKYNTSDFYVDGENIKTTNWHSGKGTSWVALTSNHVIDGSLKYIVQGYTLGYGN